MKNLIFLLTSLFFAPAFAQGNEALCVEAAKTAATSTYGQSFGVNPQDLGTWVATSKQSGHDYDYLIEVIESEDCRECYSIAYYQVTMRSVKQTAQSCELVSIRRNQ